MKGKLCNLFTSKTFFLSFIEMVYFSLKRQLITCLRLHTMDKGILLTVGLWDVLRSIFIKGCMCISKWLFNVHVHIEILTNSFVCRSQWMYNHGHSDGNWDRTLQTSPQISVTEFFLYIKLIYLYPETSACAFI